MTARDHRRYFSGDTLEQALMQAARHHAIEPEEVAYRQLEKRHGFLKIRRAVVIEVDPAAPRKSPEAESARRDAPPEERVVEAPAGGEAQDLDEDGSSSGARPKPRDTAPLDPRAADELVAAARRGLEELLAFAKLDLDAEVEMGDGELEIELRGADEERLTEDRGSLLLSIQHLLPRLIRGHTGRSIPCRVDSGGFHEARRAELEELAREAADEVRHRRRPRTLPPMNPAERRVVHLALADDKELVTESHGQGFFKRVTIRPAIRRPRGFDRYSR